MWSAFIRERNFRTGTRTGVNSYRYDSYRCGISYRYHVNKYRATSGNRDELVPEWKSYRYHVKNPLRIQCRGATYAAVNACIFQRRHLGHNKYLAFFHDRGIDKNEPFTLAGGLHLLLFWILFIYYLYKSLAFSLSLSSVRQLVFLWVQIVNFVYDYLSFSWNATYPGNLGAINLPDFMWRLNLATYEQTVEVLHTQQ